MLPARIAALQKQIAGLNAVLADPDLYARDPGRFRMTSQALAVARDELAAAEEQWPTLECFAHARAPRRRGARGLARRPRCGSVGSRGLTIGARLAVGDGQASSCSYLLRCRFVHAKHNVITS